MQGLTALAALVAIVNEPSIPNALVVLAFVSIVPGSLLVDRLALPLEGAMRWVVVIGTSLALSTLIIEAMLFAHVWTPEAGILVIALCCGGMLVYDEYRSRQLTGHRG
jgi:hypothetical protein